jgi:hypothetical protein
MNEEVSMNTNILLGGAHRGGTAITEAALKYLPEAMQFQKMTIADPKEDRAILLARLWKNSGVNTKIIKRPCEEIVDKTDADFIILSIDDVSPMATVLEKSPLPTLWQLIIKGTGMNGPVAGLNGIVSAGDTNERKASIKLIKDLGTFIQPKSSFNIRANLFNADRLPLLRSIVSLHSVMRLGMLEREPDDIPGGALNFFWAGANYPMVVQEKESHRWREIKRQVIEADLPTNLKDSPSFAVASVEDGIVDFFLVETIRRRRIIKFHMPLIHMLPNDGLEAVVAGAAVTAVVTD